jgi:hypothetical protein
VEVVIHLDSQRSRLPHAVSNLFFGGLFVKGGADWMRGLHSLVFRFSIMRRWYASRSPRNLRQRSKPPSTWLELVSAPCSAGGGVLRIRFRNTVIIFRYVPQGQAFWTGGSEC